MPQKERTLTISWKDPRVLAEAGRGLSGLEFLRKIVAGELPPPPIASLMNFDLVELHEGGATFAVNPAEYHYNPIGVVHGGLAATLLDSAMGCAIHSTLPAGAGYTTLEIKVNFVRAMTAETGCVRCEAKVIHVGGRTARAALLMRRESFMRTARLPVWFFADQVCKDSVSGATNMRETTKKHKTHKRISNDFVPFALLCGDLTTKETQCTDRTSSPWRCSP